jgi:hypothetical protein
MNMSKKELTLATFGLDNPEILTLARTLAPELFGTLFTISKLNPPFETQEDLAAALFAETDEFRGPGVLITPELFYQFLPREFFPIEDKADLLRKAYIGITAAHSNGMSDALHSFVTQTVPSDVQGVMAYSGPCGVVSASAGHKVSCPAGKWTRVLYASLVAGRYFGSFSEKNVNVQWRRYSTLTPAFAEGMHNSSNDYGGIVAYEPYVDFWFKPDAELSVVWTGRTPRPA